MKKILILSMIIVFFGACRLATIGSSTGTYEYTTEVVNNTGVDIILVSFASQKKIDSIVILRKGKFSKKNIYTTLGRKDPFIWSNQFDEGNRDSIVIIYDKKRYSTIPLKKADGTYNKIYILPPGYKSERKFMYYDVSEKTFMLGTYRFYFSEKDFQNAKSL